MSQPDKKKKEEKLEKLKIVFEIYGILSNDPTYRS